MVLTTRRCFCLFFALLHDQNFCTKLLESDEHEYLSVIEEKAISSQKIDILGNTICEKNILILDDIMIHGQAVYEIHNQILKYSPKNIDTLVMVRNIENPDHYWSNTQKDYYYIKKLPNTEWRGISNNLVKYLHDIGQCYTSYIYGFTVPVSKIKQSLKNSLKSCFAKKINLKLSSYVSYEEFCDNNYPTYYTIPISYSFVKKAILRIYKLPKNNKECRVIPYVELKEFNSEVLENSWKKIWFNEKIPKELSTLKTNKDKYRALVAICSLSLYKELFNDVPIECTYELDKSFVPNFVDIVLSNTSEKRVFNIINNCFSTTSLKVSKSLMENILSETPKLDYYIVNKWNTEKFILKYLQRYFYLVTEKEEYYKRIDNLNEFLELRPIPTSIFYLLSNEKGLNDKRTAILDGILTYFMDVGVFSHVVEELDGNVVGTCIKSGEQSYHLFADISQNAYMSLYMLLKYINDIDGFEEKQEFTSHFLKKLPKSKSINKEYKEIIEFFIKNPPIDLEESYYGVLNEKSQNTTKHDEKVAVKLMREVYKIMDVSMKESCCGCKLSIFE